MFRRLLLIAALLTGVSAQPAKMFWDGYDWLELDHLTEEYPEYRMPLKRAYLQGLLNGNLYHFFQVGAIDSNLADAVFRDYLTHFSPDELIRGTDQFYQDPANRYLPIISALMITSLRAMGFPDSVVGDYIQACRDWINHLTILTSEEVPLPEEGISMPAMPKTPAEVYLPPKIEQIRKWYNPDSLVLP